MIKVYAKTSFEGFHCWTEAPEEVAFLRNLHRHIFYVKATVKIEKDREVEFFMFQRDIEGIITERIDKDFAPSCEEMAEFIFKHLQTYGYTVSEVEVNEDSENGSVYYEN